MPKHRDRFSRKKYEKRDPRDPVSGRINISEGRVGSRKKYEKRDPSNPVRGRINLSEGRVGCTTDGIAGIPFFTFLSSGGLVMFSF